MLRLSTEDRKNINQKIIDNNNAYFTNKNMGRKVAYVIEGDILAELQQDDKLFTDLIMSIKECDSVVCCRMSPSQKATIVSSI